MSSLTYVFVHGLAGWGRYDAQYRRIPYWGMRGGDLIAHLRARGFDCHAASVAPFGSAWDRACELYAQLAGVRVDYGAAHCAEMGHERLGRDFSGDPLVPAWGDDTRLVLVGHSFGGVTARLLSELLANGDGAERAATEPGDLSPLFAGGMAERVHSVVTLAAPTNGTTAYDLFEDPGFDPDAVRVPWWSRVAAEMMARGLAYEGDGRDARDYADHDMHVDRALELNGRISTLPHAYYLAVPFSATDARQDGTHAPRRGMEALFVQRSHQMGAYAGRTAGGLELDGSWRENDGLVNTVSAGAPLGEPTRRLGEGPLEPGVWHVAPAVEGDHMWAQGGLTRTHDVRGFYERLLETIDSLA